MSHRIACPSAEQDSLADKIISSLTVTAREHFHTYPERWIGFLLCKPNLLKPCHQIQFQYRGALMRHTWSVYSPFERVC